MGQIDYFCKWVDEAAAKADAIMLAEFLDVPVSGVRDWSRDRTLPNVKAWRISQDTVVDGRIVHNYLAGWFALISLKNQVPVLLNSVPLQFCLDRDACTAGQPFVVRNNIGAVISDVGVSPIFAGSKYPIGGIS